MDVLLSKLKLSGIVSDQLFKNASGSTVHNEDDCDQPDDCDCECAW